MNNSRRRFLQIAGVATLGLGAKPVLDAFAAEPAVIRRYAKGSVDAGNMIFLDLKIHLAAHTTVRAGAADSFLIIGHDELLFACRSRRLRALIWSC